MSILSGFKKYKKYKKTSEGYQLQSQWTSSQTVEMNDGNTAETNLGAIQGITSSLASTSNNYALSASAGKNLQNQITTLNTDLEAKIKTLIINTKLPAGETTYALGQYGYQRSGMALIYATSSIDTEITILLVLSFSNLSERQGTLKIVESSCNLEGTQTVYNEYLLYNGQLCIHNKQSVHEYLTVKFIPFFE